MTWIMKVSGISGSARGAGAPRSYGVEKEGFSRQRVPAK